MTNSSPTAIKDQLLTTQEGVRLREEAVSNDGTAHRWDKVCIEFQKYLRNKTGTDDDLNSHAYSEKAAHKQYAKIRNGAEWLAENIPQKYSITTALLTIVGWHRDEKNEPAPPYDYLLDLLEGRKAVLRHLRRVLADYDFGYVWVIEPHGEESNRRAGYPHIHIGLFILGRPEDLTNQLLEKSRYYEKNAFSQREDHPDHEAVSISYPPDSYGATDLTGELTNQIIGYEVSKLDLTGRLDNHLSDKNKCRYVRLASLLWAGPNFDTWGRNNYFNECISRTQDPAEARKLEPAKEDFSDLDSNKTVKYIRTESTNVEYQYPAGWG